MTLDTVGLKGEASRNRETRFDSSVVKDSQYILTGNFVLSYDLLVGHSSRKFTYDEVHWSTSGTLYQTSPKSEHQEL